MPPDRVGIVTVLDGRPIPAGDLAGPTVAGHDSFQRGQAFIDAGGCRGLQEEVLLVGLVEPEPVVRAGRAGAADRDPDRLRRRRRQLRRQASTSTSRATTFTHGDLVERGRKGVWVEPLLPGKHPINTRVMKVELVPTTNIVLNWAQRTEAHHYDERLSSITRAVEGRLLVQPRRRRRSSTSA